MIKCNKCGTTPNNDDKINWKCLSCGKSFGITTQKLQKIHAMGKRHIKCPNCSKELNNNDLSWKCSTCGFLLDVRIDDAVENRIGQSTMESDSMRKVNKIRKNNVESLRIMRGILFTLMVILFGISIVTFFKSSNARKEYRIYEKINDATEAASNLSLCAYSFICGIILINPIVGITIKIYENE